MSKFTQHIIKNQEIVEKVDRYNTGNMSISEKLLFYDKKLREMQKIKNEHKNELSNLKSLKTSSVNVLQFKLDEMTKKMRNEINTYRNFKDIH